MKSEIKKENLDTKVVDEVSVKLPSVKASVNVPDVSDVVKADIKSGKSSETVFWKEGKVQPTLLYNYFTERGVGLYYSDSSKVKGSIPKVVQEINNIVYEITDTDLMQMAKAHILKVTEKDGDHEPILDSLHRSITLFSNKNLNFLHKLDLDFVEDDKLHANFFFANCMVQVSAADINYIPYDKVDGCVWYNSIIKHEIQLGTSGKTAVFDKFLRNVTKVKDSSHWKDRFNTLRSAIGYMLHRYKSDGITKAVILMDEYSNGIPNGGSGKTLIAKAIGRLREVHTLDGKFYDPRQWYKFGSVTLSTAIILFDDIQQGFNFENLFPIMTTGIGVEQKYKNKFYIPYEKSPKVMITTNYAINGEGSSFNRRAFEFEVSHYYSDKLKPDEEFKQLFFTDWDDSEFNLFYNMMFECCKLYLSKGFVYSKPLNIKKTKLIYQTSEDFLEFGYFGLNSATYFGVFVPVISV